MNRTRSQITTHILNTSQGRPAEGVQVELEMLGADGRFEHLGTGTTDADGRVQNLLSPTHMLERGNYRLRFASGDYFARYGIATFYPSVEILFHISNTTEHYHVPLLLNPFGYSTYRGS